MYGSMDKLNKGRGLSWLMTGLLSALALEFAFNKTGVINYG